MLGFLKVFLQGILYVVLLPLILLVLAGYAVYCLIIFIYMAIRSVIVFFMGGSPLGDLPEDVEAKRILMEREEQKANTMQTFADALVQSQVQIAQSMLQQQNLNPRPVTSDLEQHNTFETEDVKEEEFDDGHTN